MINAPIIFTPEIPKIVLQSVSGWNKGQRTPEQIGEIQAILRKKYEGADLSKVVSSLKNYRAVDSGAYEYGIKIYLRVSENGIVSLGDKNLRLEERNLSKVVQNIVQNIISELPKEIATTERIDPRRWNSTATAVDVEVDVRTTIEGVSVYDRSEHGRSPFSYAKYMNDPGDAIYILQYDVHCMRVGTTHEGKGYLLNLPKKYIGFIVLSTSKDADNAATGVANFMSRLGYENVTLSLTGEKTGAPGPSLKEKLRAATLEAEEFRKTVDALNQKVDGLTVDLKGADSLTKQVVVLTEALEKSKDNVARLEGIEAEQGRQIGVLQGKVSVSADAVENIKQHSVEYRREIRMLEEYAAALEKAVGALVVSIGTRLLELGMFNAGRVRKKILETLESFQLPKKDG